MSRVGESPLNSPQFIPDEDYFGTKADIEENFGGIENVALPDIRAISLMKQEQVLGILKNPQIQQTPHLLAEVWTGTLLNYKLRELGVANPGETRVLNSSLLTAFRDQVVGPTLQRKSEPFYTREDQKAAQQMLNETDPNDEYAVRAAASYLQRTRNSTPRKEQRSEWDRILYNVAKGESQMHEVLLATWQASGDDPLFCIKPLPLGKDEDGVIGDWARARSRPAQVALASYCMNNELGRFNVTAPHLPLKVQAHLIKSGFLSDLDITHPDYTLFALLDDLDKYLAKSVTTKSGSDSIGGDGISPEISLCNGLTSYRQDVIAYGKGDTTVANRLGSPWRFLQEGGKAMYGRYLNRRERLVEKADGVFYDSISSDPSVLQSNLTDIIKFLHQSNIPEDKLYKAKEYMGSIWAAMTLRQDEEAIRQLSINFSPWIKQQLETYMLDGLALLEKKTRQTPIWMKQLAYTTCFTKNGHLHPFTEDFGSVDDDKKATFDALSLRYSHKILIKDKSGNTQVKRVKHYTKEHNGIMLSAELYRRMSANSDVAGDKAFSQCVEAIASIDKKHLTTTLRNLPSRDHSFAQEIINDLRGYKRYSQRGAYRRPNDYL